MMQKMVGRVVRIISIELGKGTTRAWRRHLVGRLAACLCSGLLCSRISVLLQAQRQRRVCCSHSPVGCVSQPLAALKSGHVAGS